jgi:exodeoxyribonuclease V beta subunit
MTGAPHLVFALPLVGCHRIEASAGTGKTFTLALLHTRLVIERGLSVRQILAVTFTNAATQELRARLRRQLELAARLAALPERALHALIADTGSDAEQRLTAQLIARRLDDEPGERLAARLREAAAQMDLAAVFTIHGFCQRALAEHALATGEALQPRELLSSERSLLDETAHAIWRQWSRHGADAQRLPTLWPSPEALADDLPTLLRASRLLPASGVVDEAAEAQAQQAAAQLRESWRRHGDAAQTTIMAAHAAKVFNGNRLRSARLQELWHALAEFADDPTLEAPATDALDRLHPLRLREFANTGRVDEVPHSPLFDAIAHFLDARAAQQRAQAQARANLLQRLRDEARERLARHKHERGQCGFDDLIAGVADALRGAHGEALALALRQQYPVALVDEFQDTDARQWQIFRRLYVDLPAGDDAVDTPLALMLIGDPKQAIYRFRGGDLDTYHRAGGSAASTHALHANFRSRPSLLTAIEALFARGGDTPFGDTHTLFPTVQAGGSVRDADFVLGHTPAPALHLWQLPLRTGDCTRASARTPPRIKAEPARMLATEATVARIHALLGDAHARLRDGDALRPVRPGDIAVLVGNHAQAAMVQQALAAAGIAAVTAGRASLYASEQAREVLWLLEALRDLGHDGRLRCALLSVLLGQDAAVVAALDADEAAHRQWLDRFAQWRQRWDAAGPLAMLGERVADAAPRLLALADGERRLSNYLQLAEQLQEASAGALGNAGLVDWLAQRIALADDRDETQQLRLESDAQRVRILTLHKAKGLEFVLVLLPFVALPASGSRSQGLALLECASDDDESGGRTLHARIEHLNDDAYAAAKASAAAEAQAEQRRLLYVGLTRARHGLWLACGAINGSEHSALMQLLCAAQPCSDAELGSAIDQLAAASSGSIVREPCPSLPSPLPELRELQRRAPPPLREAARVLRRDWWVYSFSQLARADGGHDDGERGADDETIATEAPDSARSALVGARFGNVLHAALERVDFARWRAGRGGWQRDDEAPDAQAPLLREALREGGFDTEPLLDEGSRLLARLIGHTLNVPLPEGVRLCELAAEARRHELEFHFALQPLAVSALLDLLHRHHLLQHRQGFGGRERLEGLMTGKIDLVYRHADRYYLLDYKSNRLPGYAPTDLAEAMAHGQYDLQYLIYSLALHRWLRFRLPRYRYAEHFGGVRYLFCRGLDARHPETPGVFACRPEESLIDALDRLFGQPDAEAA